jgi:hypothetical protein
MTTAQTMTTDVVAATAIAGADAAAVVITIATAAKVQGAS